MANAGPSGHHLFLLDSPGHGDDAGSNSGPPGGYFTPLTAAEEEVIAFSAADLPYEGKGKEVACFPKRLHPAEHITRIHVDPQQPFKPLEPADGLPTFRPESITRALRLEGHWLEVVGLLYPQATFCVTLWPPSENTTVRMTGLALAKFGVLLPSEARGGLYTVDLRIRDWPSGGVARIPDTPDARQLVEELQGGFDTLVDGEVWLFGGYNEIHDGTGQVDHVIKVLRGYEGVDGPQSDDMIKHWLDTHSGYLDDDENGRKVAEMMEYNHDVLDNPDAAPKRKKVEVVTPFRANQASDENQDGDDGDGIPEGDGVAKNVDMEVDLPVLSTPRHGSGKKMRVKRESGDAPSSGRRRASKRKRHDNSDGDSDGEYVNYYAVSRGESRSSAVSRPESKRTPRSARLRAQEALRAEAEAAAAETDMENQTEEDFLNYADVKAEPEVDSHRG